MENRTIKQLYTKQNLIDLFRRIGITSGMIIELHVSMSKIGFIIGGAETLIDALMEVLGYNGTLIMAMQCAENSEPSRFEYPPIAPELFKLYRKHLPAYSSLNSETSGMGRVCDNLRRRSKSVISTHPNTAFVAIGKYAKLLCNNQNLDYGLNELSPLGRLYELKASVLLIGVDYDNLTSLHLSEYKSEVRPIIINGAAYEEDGVKRFKKYLDLNIDSDDGFTEIGKNLERKGLVAVDKIGNANVKLLRVDVAVDEGMRYYKDRMKYYF